jgi:hypothetical protein
VPQPSYPDLRRFCEIDGWEETTKRRRSPDHTRFRKVLEDGQVLRTKVSHGRGRVEDPALWNRIWRDQLRLGSEDEFWAALRAKQAVDRAPPAAPSPPRGPSKPGWLVNSLIFTAGLAEQEVEQMSHDAATQRWLEFCEREPALRSPRGRPG